MPGALIPKLESAPERRGKVLAVDLTGWTGGTPLSSGTWLGDADLTFTFTADQTGTAGTTTGLTLSWSDATRSGVLHIGDGYTVDDEIPVIDGLVIQINASAGNTAAETFTAAVEAHAQIRRDHKEITGDGQPVSLVPSSFEFIDSDIINRAVNLDAQVEVRGKLRAFVVAVDSMKPDDREKLLHMIHNNHEATVYENYDSHTVFLLRGSGGPFPFVGRPLLWTRTGVASYFDHHRQLYRHVQTGVPRVGHAGKRQPSLVVSRANRTNLLTQSHGKSGTPGWLLQGVATTTWDPTMPPVLDPTDSDWEDGTTLGSVRCYIPQGAADGVWTTPAVNAVGSVIHTAYAWIKGRGIVTVRLWNHTTSAAVDTKQVTLTDEWQQVVVSGTAVTANPHRIHVLTNQSGDEEAFCWLSHAQFQTGEVATTAIKSAGSAGTYNADVATIQHPPPISGSFSFWVNPGSELAGGASNYYFFDTDTITGWAIYATPGSNTITLETASAGNRATTGTHTLTDETWTHICVTWDRSTATPDKLTTFLYVNGVQIATSTDRDWDLWSVDTNGIRVGSSVNGVLWDWSFQEIRMDSRAWTAAEVQRQYDRIGEDMGNLHHIDHAGRRFLFDGSSEVWSNEAHPDRFTAIASLIESTREADSVVVPR